MKIKEIVTINLRNPAGFVWIRYFNGKLILKDWKEIYQKGVVALTIEQKAKLLNLEISKFICDIPLDYLIVEHTSKTKKDVLFDLVFNPLKEFEVCENIISSKKLKLNLDDYVKDYRDLAAEIAPYKVSKDVVTLNDIHALSGLSNTCFISVLLTKYMAKLIPGLETEDKKKICITDEIF